MKNKLLYIFMAVSLMGGMSSCNEKWEVPNEDASKNEDGTGMLSTRDLVIDVINAEQIRESRASEDFSNYTVSVIAKTTTDTITWKYSEMPGLPVLKVGDYTLKVESGKLQKAAWNSPYFVGSKDFTIIKDQITNIGTVTCKLQNLKVSVIFDDELRAASGNDVQCEIQTVSEGTEDGFLVYTLDESRDGYFELPTGNSTMLAKFTGTVNNYPESFVTTFTEVKAGQHYIITFKLRTGEYEIPEATGTVNFGNLNIDMSVTGHDMTNSIDPGEDIIQGTRPGQEEWPGGPVDPGTDPDKPTPSEDCIYFTSVDKNGEQLLDLSDDNINHAPDFGEGKKQALVTIDAEHLFSKLEVTINSVGLNEDELETIGLPKSFDLANPRNSDEEEAFTQLKFPFGDSVRGKKTVDFEITGFVPLLPAFEGPHSFVIKVTDKEGHEKSLILNFVNE